MSELSKYLNEQLGVFLNAKQQKLAKNVRQGFLSEFFLHNVIFYQVLMSYKFLKISYVLLWYSCGPYACNFIKKETQEQLSSWKFCKTF